jgi:hypothetical protein
MRLVFFESSGSPLPHPARISWCAGSGGAGRERLGEGDPRWARGIQQGYSGHVSREGIGIMLKAIFPDVLPQPNHTRHGWAGWDAYIYALDPDTLYSEFHSGLPLS